MAILTAYRRGRSRRFMGAGSVLVCALAGMIPAAAETVDEYKLKAAYLYNFGKFVEWPSDTSHGAGQHFAICVLGEDPFGRALEDVVAGKMLSDRMVRIIRLSSPAQAATCQILFICSSERKRMSTVLAALPPAGILTVGEMDGFIDAEGIINFTLADGHLRFQINRRAAARSHLVISSRLLSLAQIVDK